MSKRQITRRQLIKILAAATGTAVLSSVPNRWKTPIVEVGVLPAHAQGSLRTGTISGGVFEGQALKPNKPNTPRVGVPGATVSVDGTALSAITASDGLYSIPNVPAGTYNLTCSNVSGLFPNPDHLTGIVVTAGGTSPNNDFFLNLG